MTHDNDELMRFHVSSAPFTQSGQLDAFLEVWGRKMLRMDIETLHGHPLQFEAVLRSLPGFAMASGPRSPMRVHRTADLIDHDDLLLIVMARGNAELNQHGRPVAIGEGEAVLSANGTPATFTMPTPSSTITYRFSRDLLAPRIPNLDDLVACPIARDSQVLRLLVGYSDVLNDQSALATPELRRAVATHMLELAVLLLDGRNEKQAGEGLRAARLKALKDDILGRIAQSSLSVEEIASSQQISERYIRQLFATEGTTFTDFVREARLARAWRMLTDVSQLHRPIHAIAHESGFADLSYFNRAFRQQYNMTPSDARERARQAG